MLMEFIIEYLLTAKSKEANQEGVRERETAAFLNIVIRK